MKKIIIAIDGYSSCGKSTLARQLAKALGYVYIDSGAMYRAIALYFLRNHINETDPLAVEAALYHISLRFEKDEQSGESHICLNGENVEPYIRAMEVAEAVSRVAAIKAVRVFAVAQQRAMGAEKGIVMDGRDIGTTVFPQAELKIFMTADPAVRAQRRLNELQQKNPNITQEEVVSNIQMRDHADMNRAESPLQQASDAVVIDNTALSPEEQFALALEYAQARLH